jgi:hypothetical protein
MWRWSGSVGRAELSLKKSVTKMVALRTVEFFLFLTMCYLSSPAVAKNEDTSLSPNERPLSHATSSQKTRITYADHAVARTAEQG